MAAVCRMGLAPVLLAVLLATAATTSRPAGASQITFFRSMGCQGNSLSVVECGQCFDLTMYGGYQFVYSDGQPVTFYNAYGCRDDADAGTLTHSDSYCGGLKFLRSVVLSCGPAKE